MRKLLPIVFAILSYSLVGQNFLSWKFKDRYFSFTLGTGTATYFGELNYNNTINDRLSVLNTGIEARLLSRLGARIDATYFAIEGMDSAAPDSTFERQRNLSFNSRNFQVQLNAIYYFRRYRGEYHRRWNIDPYIFSGIGYTFFNPTAELGGETYSLRPAKTEGVSYKKWVWNIPIGGGLKFKINEFTNINLEVAYHFAFTDYLDDVSNTFATEFPNSTAELLSNRKDEVGVIVPEFYDQMVPGSRRGDPSNDDQYLFIMLKLELFIPPELFSKKEPVIRKPSY